jgi:hypothetical protein
MRLSEPSYSRKWQAGCLHLRDDEDLEFPLSSSRAVAKMLKAAGWYAAKTTVSYTEFRGQASP